MSTKKKSKKSFFSGWKKKGNVADGLSTTFFELKLNSSPVYPSDPPEPLPQTLMQEKKGSMNEHIKMEAPLHLINVIL